MQNPGHSVSELLSSDKFSYAKPEIGEGFVGYGAAAVEHPYMKLAVLPAQELYRMELAVLPAQELYRLALVVAALQILRHTAREIMPAQVMANQIEMTSQNLKYNGGLRRVSTLLKECGFTANNYI